MVERFFSYAPTATPPHEDTGITLVSGPSCCGKTSLLFQFAANRAAESGRDVVFICSKGRLETNPPFLSQGVEPSMGVLQRIKINGKYMLTFSSPRYVEDGEEIRKYFAAFHLLDDFPAAVIVDDFADFFSERTCQQRYGNSRAQDLGMVRILALCHDAIAHANTKLGSLGSCSLLLSDVHQGDGTGSYILEKIGSAESGTREARTAKYSIALQYLVLEEISC
ncbi:hypothetical protein PR202_gb08228 [Eleusine coracana subsp. coracana]|uniref:Uncharacterized protein n=1 Tax=Eleusine coracana subsp. coracana TaxID=191504 RepID=A0AAV5EF75_ELECO|nr:hypothetical protein PR202_gb08228 [Eleusine coracana subsp. coracana]